MGGGLLRQGQPERAIEPLQHALGLAPDDFNAFANLSRAYAETQRWTDLRAAQARLDRPQS